MLQQIKVYITAKREHGEKILKTIPDRIHCNSRWIYMLHTPDRPVTHWLRENFDDAIASHFVVFYVQPEDNLKTSLLEIGNAIAHGKQIRIASNYKPDPEVEDDFIPNKGLLPWIGFTSQIKYIGTLEQTFAYIKKEVEQKLQLNHDGSKSS